MSRWSPFVLLFALLVSPAAAQTIPSGAWGSINYWGVGGLSQVLAPGLAGQCLTSQNVGSAPIWVNCQVSSLSLLPPISANSIMANNTLNFVAPQAIDVNRVLDMVGYDIIRPPVAESIIYKSNVGPNFNWQTLPPGTAGSLLTSGGPTNPIFWAPSAAAGNLAAICTTVGAVLYFDTPSLLWKCLNPGTSGQLLQTGGAAGNPSWLTVTLATLGGVPSTRNVNTSAPLTGGGALSADLTLACATCATTTNGGALSATAPVTLSAAGVIAMTNQGTTTTVLHGNAVGNPSFGAVALATDVSGTLLASSLPPGVWTNTRLAKTAAYPAVSADCGSTIALGGAAFYALTINAASGYAANCVFVVVNEDTGAGKAISINGTAFGVSNCCLWPGQTTTIFNDNNVWKLLPVFQRWKVPNGQIFRLDAINGLDTNDCLAAGAGRACQSFNGLVRVYMKDWFDFSGVSAEPNGTAIIQLANNATGGGGNTTTCSPNCYGLLHLATSFVGWEGSASLVIQGNAGDPSLTVVEDSTGSNIGNYGFIGLALQNFQVHPGGACGTQIGIESSFYASTKLLGGMILGCTTSAQMNINRHGRLSANAGTISIGGNGQQLGITSEDAALDLSSASVSFLANTTYSAQTLNAGFQSVININPTTWTLNAHTITGQRWFASQGSVISTGTGTPNTTIPGNSNGTGLTGASVD